MAAHQEHERAVKAVWQSAGAKDLAVKLGLDQAQRRMYAYLRVDLTNLVGLQPLKDTIEQQIADMVGRRFASEEGLRRHTFLFGAVGTGKRTSAQLLARLWEMFGMCGDNDYHGHDHAFVPNDAEEWDSHVAEGNRYAVVNGKECRVHRFSTTAIPRARGVGSICVGSRVKAVDQSHGWGGVSRGDVGTVVRSGGDGKWYVDFPNQAGWHAETSDLRCLSGGGGAPGATPGAAFKKRADFGGKEEYGRYVRANYKMGMMVRALEDYSSIKRGDIVTMKEDDGSDNPSWWNKDKSDYHYPHYYCFELLPAHGGGGAPGAFKKRADFGSEGEYGRYVRANYKMGMMVRALEDHGSIECGDIVTMKEDDGSDCPYWWNKDKSASCAAYYRRFELLDGGGGGRSAPGFSDDGLWRADSADGHSFIPEDATYAKSAEVSEAFLTEHFVEIATLQELTNKKLEPEKVEPRTVYFLRCTGKEQPAQADLIQLCDTVLARMDELGSTCIFAGTEIEMALYRSNLRTWRRNTPREVELLTLKPVDLARLTANLAHSMGYAIRRDRAGAAGDLRYEAAACPATEEVDTMHWIVQEKYEADVIAERNAYLMRDMLDEAIRSKNESCAQLDLPPLVLTPADFSVEKLSEEALERLRLDVDAEIAAAVGWDDLKSFFRRARQLTQAGEGASVGWNMVVAGGKGTGKTKAAELVTRFLRAYGVTTKDGPEACRGGDISPGPKGRDALATVFANARNGVVIIDRAEELCGKTAAVEVLLDVMGEASSVNVILTGKMGAASGSDLTILLREDGMQAKFPEENRVELADFQPAEITEIAEGYALREKNCLFAEGLAGDLTSYIEFEYLQSLHACGAGHLAVRLIEDAVRSLVERRARGEIADEEAPVLVRSDFPEESIGGKQSEKDDIDREVEDLIGMSEAKELFAKLKKRVSYAVRTGDRSAMERCRNIVITGNPGTGKTQYAKLLFKFYKAYGVLSRDGIFVYRNGTEMKGQTLGSSGPLVRAACRAAMGGMLFIDEAYALADGDGPPGSGGDSFAKEAVRSMLTEFEENRTSLLVVMAGYQKPMEDFMRMDPGLNRRFPMRIHIDSYTAGDIARITELKARRSGMGLEDGLLKKIEDHISSFYRREMPQLNAGLADKLVEDAIDKRIDRLCDAEDAMNSALLRAKEVATQSIMTRRTTASSGSFSASPPRVPGSPQRSPSAPYEVEVFANDAEKHGGGSAHCGGARREPSLRELVQSFVDPAAADPDSPSERLLKAEDFGISARPELGDPKLQEQVEAEVEALIGNRKVKKYCAELKSKALFVQGGGNIETLFTAMHMRITGNPGTGKTTCARLISRYMSALGLLPRNRFVECNALELKGSYVGQTAPIVVNKVQSALGGCLFLDEAYALADRGGDAFSDEAVRTLLTEVENNRTDFMCVLAGYADKMERLMEADPGLPRRFAIHLKLDNYTAPELALICLQTATKKFGYRMDEQLVHPVTGEGELSKWIIYKYSDQMAESNAGLAKNITEAAANRLANRFISQNLDAQDPNLLELLAEDFRIDFGSPGAPTTPPPPPPPPPPLPLARVLMKVHDKCGPSFDRTGIQKLFDDAGITDDIVGELTEDGLEKIGIARYGDRLRVWAALREHGLVGRPAPANAAPPTPAPPKTAMAMAMATKRPPQVKKSVKSEAGAEEAPEEEEEEEEEEEPEQEAAKPTLSLDDARDLVNRIGQCTAGYDWIAVPDERPADGSSKCDGLRDGTKCVNGESPVAEGFNCSAGGHWICMDCIYQYDEEHGQEEVPEAD